MTFSLVQSHYMIVRVYSIATGKGDLCNHNMESWLEINYAQIIDDLQREIDDYPVYACCSCECLLQSKSVTGVTLDDDLGGIVRLSLKSFIFITPVGHNN